MTSRSIPQFFAETDVAAVRYGPGDDPDALLKEFMRRRLGEGYDVLGLLQRRVEGARCRQHAVAFELAPGFEWPNQAGAPAPAPGERLSVALDQLAEQLRLALKRRPDLVVLNRFGRAEAHGEGLLKAMTTALDRDIPIVIAVPDGLYEIWNRISAGRAVTVRPQAEALDAWWRSLGHGPRKDPDGGTMCELAK